MAPATAARLLLLLRVGATEAHRSVVLLAVLIQLLLELLNILQRKLARVPIRINSSHELRLAHNGAALVQERENAHQQRNTS